MDLGSFSFLFSYQRNCGLLGIVRLLCRFNRVSLLCWCFLITRVSQVGPNLLWLLNGFLWPLCVRKWKTFKSSWVLDFWIQLPSKCVFVVSLCLQGGGAGESTHRQPHGPQQPLHPGRPRKQLLRLPALPERLVTGAAGTPPYTQTASTPLTRRWTVFHLQLGSREGGDDSHPAKVAFVDRLHSGGKKRRSC